MQNALRKCSMKSKKLLFSIFVIVVLALCALLPMPNPRQTNEADIIANGRYIWGNKNAD